jgi:DNA-binding NtrC family response regulator
VTTDSAVWCARQGTLVLAHLTDAPARVQARLARVLRDGEVLDQAGQATDLEICLVATLESPLQAAVQDGRLRRDLAERLGVVVEVPPLRQRREDIPMLAVQLLRQACARLSVPPRAFSRAALALVAALPWPGNVADLVALVDSLAATATGTVVQLEDVLAHARMDGAATRIDAGGTLRDARQRFEREWISAMLIRHHGRVGETAKALGIQRTNLYRKVRQLKVEKALLSSRRA